MAKDIEPNFLQKTSKGLFVRKNAFSCIESSVAQYIDRINRICLPLLSELSMNESVPQILRYCSKGGFERMRKEFLEQFPNGSAFQRVARSQFQYVSEKHPEFKEIANSWKYAHLICLDENGLLDVDLEACEERKLVYISSPEGMDFVAKLQKLVDKMNEIIPSYVQQPVGTLSAMLFFDNETKKIVINPQRLESLVGQIIEKPLSMSEHCKRNAIKANQQLAIEREELKAELTAQGVSPEEFEIIVGAARDLQDCKVE